MRLLNISGVGVRGLSKFSKSILPSGRGSTPRRHMTRYTKLHLQLFVQGFVRLSQRKRPPKKTVGCLVGIGYLEGWGWRGSWRAVFFPSAIVGPRYQTTVGFSSIAFRSTLPGLRLRVAYQSFFFFLVRVVTTAVYAPILSWVFSVLSLATWRLFESVLLRRAFNLLCALLFGVHLFCRKLPYSSLFRTFLVFARRCMCIRIT